MKQTRTIHIDGTLLIGSGGVRNVYLHPHDRDKCIKITHNHQRDRSVRREIMYLLFYSLIKKPTLHLPKFHGLCKTNIGRGAVFGLFRDFDGQRSVKLSDHISGKASPCLQPEKIVQLLNSLHHHLLEHQIIVCDPAPHNLLVHYPTADNPRLVIIDGIGNPQFIKIADISNYFARKAINKKWRKYIEDNPTLKPIFRQCGYTRRTM